MSPTLVSQMSVCVFQMIEDVLGEGPVSASRFSQWFSSNMSPSGSRSSSLRSTPHEELEKLPGKVLTAVLLRNLAQQSVAVVWHVPEGYSKTMLTLKQPRCHKIKELNPLNTMHACIVFISSNFL